MMTAAEHARLAFATLERVHAFGGDEPRRFLEGRAATDREIDGVTLRAAQVIELDETPIVIAHNPSLVAGRVSDISMCDGRLYFRGEIGRPHCLEWLEPTWCGIASAALPGCSIKFQLLGRDGEWLLEHISIGIEQGLDPEARILRVWTKPRAFNLFDQSKNAETTLWRDPAFFA